MKCEIAIKVDKNELNVTKRSAIYYGAGQVCIELSDFCQIPNIEYIVDGDKKKWGTVVQLNNKKYIVNSPQILEELEADKYYIVILTDSKYVNEILCDIKRYAGDKFPVCIGIDNIFYIYDSVMNLFLCDPFMAKKVAEQHISVCLYEYISKFNLIISKYLSEAEINYFVPIKKGSKAMFLFGNGQKRWVFSMPGIFSLREIRKEIWGGWTKDIDNIEEIYQIKNKYRLEGKLTIYEDEEGYLLQHYANNAVDYSVKEVRMDVLKKCRKLHQINDTVKIEIDVTKRYEELSSALVARRKDLSGTEKALHEKMQPYLQYLKNPDIPKRICHGDLHHGNIVCLDRELFFIDWEFLCMADPMYDVCRFLYYSSFDEFSQDLALYEKNMERLYMELADYLSVYYDRRCSQEEYRHMFAMMLFCENIELLLRAVNRNMNIDKMADIILGHIESFSEMEKSV